MSAAAAAADVDRACVGNNCVAFLCSGYAGSLSRVRELFLFLCLARNAWM